MVTKSKVHGFAVASKPSGKSEAKITPKVTDLAAGSETVVQWFDLHGFADKNIRADSFGNPLADLYDQVRPLGETDNGVGQKRPETDEDRATRHMKDGSLVGLLLPGWDREERHAIIVTVATPDEQRKAIQERRDTLIAWRGRGAEDNTYLALAAFVEQYWFPRGEAHLPRAIVHNCHRRTSAMPGAVFARAQRGIGIIGDYAVPVAVRQPMAALAEIDERLKENLGHNLGRSEMSPLDYLRIAKMIIDAGGTESMLRKYGKVGEAQTAFRFMQVNNRFPHLHLYERAMLPRPQLGKGEKKYKYTEPGTVETLADGTEVESIGSFIPYSTSMKEALQALLSDKDYKASGSMSSRASVPTTTEIVEDFAAYYTSGGRVKGGWTQNDTKALREATKFGLWLNIVGLCIDTNKQDLLRAIDKRFGKEFDDVLRDAGVSMDDIATGKLLK